MPSPKFVQHTTLVVCLVFLLFFLACRYLKLV